MAAGAGCPRAHPHGHRLTARHRARSGRRIPAGAAARPDRGRRRGPMRPAAPDHYGELVLRGLGSRDAGRHRSGPVLAALCRLSRRERRRRTLRARPAGVHARHRRHRPPAQQRQRAELPEQRHRPADRRPGGRYPPRRLWHQVADLRGCPQLPAVRRRHVPDLPDPRPAPVPQDHDQRRGPRHRPRDSRAARTAPREGAASCHGHLPDGQRIAQRRPHPPGHPAARRRRAHRIPAVQPGRGFPDRRPRHPPAPGPGPAPPPADRQPDRNGRRVLPAVHLSIARHRAAGRRYRRPGWLHVTGDSADRHAAGDPRRGTRPGERGIPHQRGSRHSHRCRGRALPRPGRAADRSSHRRQHRYPERRCTGLPDRAAGTQRPTRPRSR